MLSNLCKVSENTIDFRFVDIEIKSIDSKKLNDF